MPPPIRRRRLSVGDLSDLWGISNQAVHGRLVAAGVKDDEHRVKGGFVYEWAEIEALEAKHGWKRADPPTVVPWT